MGQGPVRGAARAHTTSVDFPVLYGTATVAPDYSGDMEDHGSQITVTKVIITNTFEIL